MCLCVVSAEVELRSLKQRLEESTAVSQALRLELQLSRRLAHSTDDDKENSRGNDLFTFFCGKCFVWPTSYKSKAFSIFRSDIVRGNRTRLRCFVLILCLVCLYS